MSTWSPLQVILAMSLYLTWAEITTEPFATADEYYSYEVNETMESDITLSSIFELRNYNNDCSGGEMNKTLTFCDQMEDGELETCREFLIVIKSTMEFSCYWIEDDAEIALNASIDYLNNCQERQTCSESVEIVKTLMTSVRLCNTTKAEFSNLQNSIGKIVDLQERIGPMNRTFVLGLILDHQTSLVNDLDKYIDKARDLLYYLREQNVTSIFQTQFLGNLTNIESLRIILSRQREYLIYIEERHDYWKRIDIIRYDVKLTLFLFFFLLGMAGNIILILVFVKYPDMRTTANIMLINLTLVDCVCLVLNLPLTYIKATSLWRLGRGACQAFYFTRYITICVSTYSVVTISIQRFLAVTRFPTAHGCTIGEKTKSVIMLSGVWLLAVLYSLPRLIFSEISNGMCSDVNDNIIGAITTADLLMICVVPTLVMIVFSCITAKKIKDSVANPTGERTGQEQLRQNRVLSANVLTGLAVLFVVSYFPSFLLYFVRFQMEVEMGALEMHVVDTVTYILQFSNSCLNPISLCIMSRKYRTYFQEILSCCKIPLVFQKSLGTSATSVSTTESSM